ncbi:MAG TPA: deoxyguanosinetriphosphate triphosphohydrolase, partial [Desulfoprunum sp.]|nr:deoxyguanosinetriphosphate triphosphohydrolase [Desulfoprunum sp.]
DALRSGVLKGKDLPQKIKDVVGERHSKRIGAMVRDLIVETLRADDGQLHISEAMLEAITDLRAFLYENVYRYYKVHNEFEKAQKIIRELYGYFFENGLSGRIDEGWEPGEEESDWPNEKIAHRKVCDYIAGMTDRYALNLYEQIFLPKPWSAR